MKNIKFHIPVLLNTATEYILNPEIETHTIVDGTTGGGSYSEEIAKRLNVNCKLICIDKDLNALEFSKNKLTEYSGKIIFINGNFGNLKKLLNEFNTGIITGLILDLGLSEYQLTDEEGFSFMRDTNLDMRADKEGNLTADEIVNTYSRFELIKIFTEFGEIGNSERLADAIIRYRNVKRIKTTFDLTDAIMSEYKLSDKNKYDFYAKIFQSLRIAVNNELENLSDALKDSFDMMREGGRIVVVSYHSLEDRIVKNFFKEKSFTPSVSKYGKEALIKNKKLKLITKKAIVPDRKEIFSNPKSRSAKLRAAEVVWK